MIKNNSELAVLEKEAQTLLGQLKKSKNVEEFEQLLGNFKKTLLQLPGIYVSAPGNVSGTERYKILAVQGFEEAVKFYATSSAPNADVTVHKYFLLLQPFYFNKSLIATLNSTKTSSRLEIISLELFHLLVSQRLSDFYSLLERLSFTERKTDFVSFVIDVERHLTEGNYSQLLSLKQSSSKSKKGHSALFARSLDKLEETVQREVMSCLEKSYHKVTIKNAERLLGSKKENFPEHWIVANSTIYFESESLNKKPKLEKKTAEKVISETLGYAKELEKIV